MLMWVLVESYCMLVGFLCFPESKVYKSYSMYLTKCKVLCFTTGRFKGVQVFRRNQLLNCGISESLYTTENADGISYNKSYTQYKSSCTLDINQTRLELIYTIIMTMDLLQYTTTLY